MRIGRLVLGVALPLVGVMSGGLGASVMNSDRATYEDRCTGPVPPIECPSLAAEAQAFQIIASPGGIVLLGGFVLTIEGLLLKREPRTPK